MIMSHEAPEKRYGLFGLAIVMLLAAGAALFFGGNYSLVQALGGLMLVASAYLIKISNLRSGADSIATGGPDASRGSTNRLGAAVWTVGVLLLMALGISYYSPYKDALDGYHHVVPVYAFAGIGLVCGLFWAYLLAKLVR